MYYSIMSSKNDWSSFLIGKLEILQKDSSAKLSKNQNSHKNGAYICQKCENVYTQKVNLKRHIEFTHNYENATFYECKECNVKYTTNQMLKTHKLSKHEGVRFKCPTCEHEASTLNSLRVHVNAKHKGTSYSCDKCDYQNGNKYNLKRYKDATHNGLRFIYKECDNKFTS